MTFMSTIIETQDYANYNQRNNSCEHLKIVWSFSEHYENTI